MPRVLRFISLAILLLLLQANGCDDEKPRGDRAAALTQCHGFPDR